jgi:hypothetical protein
VRVPVRSFIPVSRAKHQQRDATCLGLAKFPCSERVFGADSAGNARPAILCAGENVGVSAAHGALFILVGQPKGADGGDLLHRGTYWWVNRKEQMAAIFFIQTPGRAIHQDFDNAVSQAIID